MANWQQKTDFLGGIKAPLDEINNIIKTLDTIITSIDTVNTLITTNINAVNTLQGLEIPDVTRVTTETLKNAITDYIQGFKSSGVYWLPVIPEKFGKEHPYDTVLGGYDAFIKRVTNSVDDIFDANRPVFPASSTTASIIVMIDSGSENEVLEALEAFNKVFNFGRPINLNIAQITNLQAIKGNGQIQLNWSYENGLEPSGYTIEHRRTDGGGTSQTISISNSGEQKIAYTVTGLENDLEYEFKVTPRVSIYNGETDVIRATTNSNTGSANRDATGKKACSNVGCNFSSNTKFCRLNNKNFNENKCIDGTIQCDKYKVGRCFYNDGLRCNSTGFTVSKTTINTETGSSLTISNASLYHPTYCLNGKNAQNCDGYVETNLNNEGTPPNWGRTSIQSLLPPELNQMLSETESFINGLFQKTSKVADATSTFNDVFTETTDVFKNTLLSIRNTLTTLNDLFNTPMPAVYILEVAPAVGGTEYFKNQLQLALNSPPQDPLNYNVGFVLFFGGLGPEVELAFNLWKTLISI